MLKFADGKRLTAREWDALSWLTLIDRNRLEFGPDNCRWATTAGGAHRQSLRFYQNSRGRSRPVRIVKKHTEMKTVECPTCHGVKSRERHGLAFRHARR